MTRQQWTTTLWVACGAMALGSIGPWAKALGGLISAAGTDGDGIITLIAAALIAVLARRYARGPTLVSGIAGLLAAGTAWYHLINIAATDRIEVGWGLWVTALASATILVAFVAVRAADDVEAPTDELHTRP